MLTGTYNTLICTVPATEGRTILQVLLEDMSVSTRMLRQVKRQKALTVNGHVVSVGGKARKGDVIQVKFIEDPHTIYPNDIGIDVLYEDEDLVVLNKPLGIVAHPTQGYPSQTLSNAVRHYALKKGEDYKPRLVNRLDRDTTGIIIFAKNAYGQHVVSEEMKAGRVQKFYRALVHGRVQKDDGIIDEPIDLESDTSPRRCVRPDGKPSVTHYHVDQRLTNATVLKIDLKTGRTHQIRVHMSYLGHPLVGDELYGSFEHVIIKRQALHACQMTFKTPRHGEVTIEAPLPQDIKEAIAFLS